MKGTIAFGFFILFLAALALVNIGNMAPADTADLRMPTSRELTGERWRLVALRDANGTGAAAIELQFTRGGNVAGQGRCQHFTARYKLDARSLHFSNIQSLESSCSAPTVALEPLLLAALEATERVGFDGRNLVLLGADLTRLARFLPQSANNH